MMSKDVLVSGAKYPLMLNGVPIVREDGRLFHAQAIQIENSFDEYRLDMRTYAVSIFNSLDFDEYLTYYRYVLQQMNNKFADVSKSGSIPALLDQGYIPLIMSPTFLDIEKDAVGQVLMQALETKTIAGEPIIYLRQSQYNLADNAINSDKVDIWVSRMQFAEYFKCEPQKVRITQILKFLLS